MAYLTSLQKKNPLLRRDMDANFIRWGCSAGIEVLYITPYGDVFPCPYLHESTGNFLQLDLKTIRENIFKKHPEFINYHPKCFACEDKEYMEKYIFMENHEKIVE